MFFFMMSYTRKYICIPPYTQGTSKIKYVSHISLHQAIDSGMRKFRVSPFYMGIITLL